MEKFKEIFDKYGIRMHRKQKKTFRDYVIEQAKGMNYSAKEENNVIAKNIVIGDVDKAEYVFTAHYDTPPRLPKFFVKHMMLYTVLFTSLLVGISVFVPPLLTNSISTLKILYGVFYGITYGTIGASVLHMFGFLGNANKKNFNDNTSGCYALLKLMEKYQNLPEQEKSKIAFVFFDNEEKFLLGSLTHRNKHLKTYKDKTYINLDCVGLGKQMNLYHYGKTTKIASELEKIMNEKGNNFYPKVKTSGLTSTSDHFSFQKANHVCLLSVDKDNEKSLYSQIHSSNDDKIDFSNIDELVETIGNLKFCKELGKSMEKDLTKENSKTIQQETSTEKDIVKSITNAKKQKNYEEEMQF